MVSRNSKEASISLIMKLKQTLKPKDYKAFVTVMIDYRARGICTADMLMSVNQILSSNNQLVSGFDDFLPEEYRIAAAAASPENLTWFSVKKASVDFFNRVRTTYRHDNDATYRAFLSIMGRHLSDDDHKIIDVKKVQDEVFDLFQENPSLFLEFTSLFSHQNPENSGNSNSSSRTRKKKNPNDNKSKWFQHEDRLFEMDMAIGCLESTFERSQRFLCENGMKIEEYFRVHEIKCIKNVYGGKEGEEMVKNLRVNPVDVVKNMLPRLIQKLEESRDKREGYKLKLRRMHESERKKRDTAL